MRSIRTPSRHLPSRLNHHCELRVNAIWTRSNPRQAGARSSTVPDIIGNAVIVPISPQGVAHRRVGADPANKLVIFAVSITSLAISFSFYGRLRMSNAPARYSCQR